MRNILFTSMDWNEKNKKEYFRQYMENKRRLKVWNKAQRRFRILKIGNSVSLFTRQAGSKYKDFNNIWNNILTEQLHYPEIETSLTRKIW